MADSTAPDPDDPLVCINTRAAGGRPTCKPDLGHCEGCELCKHACACHKPTPLDKETLRAALDAHAVRHGYSTWHAYTQTRSPFIWQAALNTITAAIAPLQARIRRLTASPDPACMPSARELVDAWNRRTDEEQLALAAQFLERQEHALRCALGRCTTKENS